MDQNGETHQEESPEDEESGNQEEQVDSSPDEKFDSLITKELYKLAVQLADSEIEKFNTTTKLPPDQFYKIVEEYQKQNLDIHNVFNDLKSWVFNKGYALFFWEHYKDAILYFEASIQAYDAANHEADNFLAAVYADKGVALYRLAKYDKPKDWLEKIDEAIRCFDKALAISPEITYFWMHKGVALSIKGIEKDDPVIYQQALSCFNQAYLMDKKEIGARLGKIFTDSLIERPLKLRNEFLDYETELLEGGKKVITNSNKYLELILKDFRFGYNIVELMLLLQFLLGFVLIFAAIWMTMQGSDWLANLLVGSFGASAAILTLYRIAPLKLQKNRANLAQWTLAFFNWANTIFVTNTYLAQKVKAGEDRWEFYKEINDYLENTTKNTIETIELFCEDLGEENIDKGKLTSGKDK